MWGSPETKPRCRTLQFLVSAARVQSNFSHHKRDQLYEILSPDEIGDLLITAAIAMVSSHVDDDPCSGDTCTSWRELIVRRVRGGRTAQTR